MFEKGTDPESARYDEAEQEADYTDSPRTDARGEVPKPEDALCGIGCFTPSCIQPLAHMYAFIPTVSLSIIASFAYTIYILSQVTTLEKQFGMTSTESGLLLGASDVGFMLTILLWSHFAKKMHKPRVLALATFLFGLLAAMSVIPHFLMTSQASEMYATAASSSAGTFYSRSLCLARNVTGGQDPTETSANSARIRRIGYALIFVSFGLQGVARAPRNPLTQTYIDDNVPKTRTGIYLGVIGGLTLLGPVLGSSIGSVFNDIYVTLEETSLEQSDPRFIGAWWLGFLLLAVLAFVSAIPLLFFPKRMPNAPHQAPHPSLAHKEHANEHATEGTKDQEIKKEMDVYQDASSPVTKGKLERLIPVVKPFFNSALRISMNPLYMLIVVCDSIMFLALAGRLAFYPKYLQQYFRVTTSRSNLLFGVTIMLPIAAGVILSGFITHRLRLTIRGCMCIRVLVIVASLAILILSLIVTCDQPTIYGLSNPTELLKLVTPDVNNITCDTNCMCKDQDFLPSCGSDNRTYFSPCHAGCTKVLQNRDFGSCACVPESTSFNQTVSPRYCEGACSSIIFYLILSAIGAFIGGIDGVPTNVTQLRCVEERDRSMSIGIAGLLRSAVGIFAGPIIFGKVVDSACLLWKEEGSCSLYDGDDLRVKLHAFASGVMALILIANGILVLLTYKMDRYCEIVEWQRLQFEEEIAKAKKKGLKDETENNGDDMPEHAIKNKDNTLLVVDEQKNGELTRL